MPLDGSELVTLIQLTHEPEILNMLLNRLADRYADTDQGTEDSLRVFLDQIVNCHWTYKLLYTALTATDPSKVGLKRLASLFFEQAYPRAALTLEFAGWKADKPRAYRMFTTYVLAYINQLGLTAGKSPTEIPPFFSKTHMATEFLAWLATIHTGLNIERKPPAGLYWTSKDIDYLLFSVQHVFKNLGLYRALADLPEPERIWDILAERIEQLPIHSDPLRFAAKRHIRPIFKNARLLNAVAKSLQTGRLSVKQLGNFLAPIGLVAKVFKHPSVYQEILKQVSDKTITVNTVPSLFSLLPQAIRRQHLTVTLLPFFVPVLSDDWKAFRRLLTPETLADQATVRALVSGLRKHMLSMYKKYSRFMAPPLDSGRSTSPATSRLKARWEAIEKEYLTIIQLIYDQTAKEIRQQLQKADEFVAVAGPETILGLQTYAPYSNLFNCHT
jgi:hypothetical protein